MTDNRIVLKDINGFNTIFADGNCEDTNLWYIRCKKCKLIYPFQTGFPPVKDMSGEFYYRAKTCWFCLRKRIN